MNIRQSCGLLIWIGVVIGLWACSKKQTPSVVAIPDQSASESLFSPPSQETELTPVRLTQSQLKTISLSDGLNSVNSILGLGQNSQLQGSRSDKPSADTPTRAAQLVGGIPVWGSQILIHQAQGKPTLVTGNYLAQDALPSSDLTAKLSAQTAKGIAKQHSAQGRTQVEIRHESAKLVIYPIQATSRLAWHVTLLSRDANALHQWEYFVDAAEGTVLDFYDGLISLSQASGPGGNEKFSNEWDQQLDVEQLANGTFVMDTADLITLDMNNRTSGGTIASGLQLDPFGDAAINDAHGYSEIALKVMLNWFGIDSIDNNGFPIISQVHYDQDLDNAFWDPITRRFSYGDGNRRFHALSGALDIVSHEIAHGFTAFHSDLIYRRQSGGINESFSDIAGISANWFQRPTTADLTIGGDVVKPAFGLPAFRFLCDPKRDRVSLAHFLEYDDSANVHHSSGIMNLAFCRAVSRFAGAGDVSAAPSQDAVKDVAAIFYKANESFWTQSSTFTQAAQGTVDAATALNYSAEQIRWLVQSWIDVGVSPNGVRIPTKLPIDVLFLAPEDTAELDFSIDRINNFAGAVSFSHSELPSGVTASFDTQSSTGTNFKLTLNSDASVRPSAEFQNITTRSDNLLSGASYTLFVVPRLSLDEPQQELAQAAGGVEIFKFTVPRFARGITISTQGSGNVDLFVRPVSRRTGWECTSLNPASTESCSISEPAEGDWIAVLFARAGYSGTTLSAQIENVGIAEFSLESNEILGSQALEGKIRLNSSVRTGERVVIFLSSSSPSVKVPRTIEIPPGARDAKFSVETLAVTEFNRIQLTASLKEQSKNTQLGVKPAQGPQSDSESLSGENEGETNNVAAAAASGPGSCASVRQPANAQAAISWFFSFLFLFVIIGQLLWQRLQKGQQLLLSRKSRKLLNSE